MWRPIWLQEIKDFVSWVHNRIFAWWLDGLSFFYHSFCSEYARWAVRAQSRGSPPTDARAYCSAGVQAVLRSGVRKHRYGGFVRGSAQRVRRQLLLETVARQGYLLAGPKKHVSGQLHRWHCILQP